MGFAWALLMPALTISAGLIIKGALARGGGDTPSISGIALKSWAWAFFAGAMNFATMSLLTNISLVTKIWFPREVLPLSSVLAQCVDALVGLVVLGLVAPLLGVSMSWAILWLPLLLVILFVFTTGLAFLFACANIFFRDVKYILQVLLTFGIFFTPVLLEPSQMGRFAEIMMMNPLAPILEGLRFAVTEGHNLLRPLDVGGVVGWRPWWLAYSAGTSMLLLWGSLRLFRASTASFAESY